MPGIPSRSTLRLRLTPTTGWPTTPTALPQTPTTSDWILEGPLPRGSTRSLSALGLQPTDRWEAQAATGYLCIVPFSDGAEHHQRAVAKNWKSEQVSISASVTANAYYWLAYNTNGLAANVNNLRYDTGDPTSARISPGPFGTWPTTCGPIAGTNNDALSVYAA